MQQVLLLFTVLQLLFTHTIMSIYKYMYAKITNHVCIHTYIHIYIYTTYIHVIHTCIYDLTTLPSNWRLLRWFLTRRGVPGERPTVPAGVPHGVAAELQAPQRAHEPGRQPGRRDPGFWLHFLRGGGTWENTPLRYSQVLEEKVLLQGTRNGMTLISHHLWCP